MSITTALSDLSAKRRAIEEEARKHASAILAPGLKQFMVDHPEIEAIRWEQYTPYFNDGEECIFGVHELHYKLAGDSEPSSEDDEDDDDGNGFEYLSTYGKPAGLVQQSWFKALTELSKALSGSEDELKAAFGDHVRVIVTKDGVDVEEYSHD